MTYGRATSYTDYYKNKENTPGANVDDAVDDITKKPDSMVAARKLAMKRRLLNKKKVGM